MNRSLFCLGLILIALLVLDVHGQLVHLVGNGGNIWNGACTGCTVASPCSVNSVGVYSLTTGCELILLPTSVFSDLQLSYSGSDDIVIRGAAQLEGQLKVDAGASANIHLRDMSISLESAIELTASNIELRNVSIESLSSMNTLRLTWHSHRVSIINTTINVSSAPSTSAILHLGLSANESSEVHLSNVKISTTTPTALRGLVADDSSGRKWNLTVSDSDISGITATELSVSIESLIIQSTRWIAANENFAKLLSPSTYEIYDSYIEQLNSASGPKGLISSSFYNPSLARIERSTIVGFRMESYALQVEIIDTTWNFSSGVGLLYFGGCYGAKFINTTMLFTAAEFYDARIRMDCSGGDIEWKNVRFEAPNAQSSTPTFGFWAPPAGVNFINPDPIVLPSLTPTSVPTSFMASTQLEQTEFIIASTASAVPFFYQAPVVVFQSIVAASANLEVSNPEQLVVYKISNLDQGILMTAGPSNPDPGMMSIASSNISIDFSLTDFAFNSHTAGQPQQFPGIGSTYPICNNLEHGESIELFDLHGEFQLRMDYNSTSHTANFTFEEVTCNALCDPSRIIAGAPCVSRFRCPCTSEWSGHLCQCDAAQYPNGDCPPPAPPTVETPDSVPSAPAPGSSSPPSGSPVSSSQSLTFASVSLVILISFLTFMM
jgi:hypothetical protein